MKENEHLMNTVFAAFIQNESKLSRWIDEQLVHSSILWSQKETDFHKMVECLGVSPPKKVCI